MSGHASVVLCYVKSESFSMRHISRVCMYRIAENFRKVKISKKHQ